MKRLLKLAQEIKSKSLRGQVADLLRDLRLSSKDFKKYKKEDLKRAGSMFVIPTSGMGPIERDIIEHTVALAELCIKTVDVFKKSYGLKLNKDHLVAAAIVHDLAKAFEYKRNKAGDLEPTGVMLDHTMLVTAELYSRDFPEEVIHIVASHFGESGPTPPRSFEALIFHHLDSLVSIIEYYHRLKKKMDHQIIFLSEGDLERLGEKTGKIK